MNRGMLKLTAMVALSTALGVGLTVNNAKADDNTNVNGGTTEQVVTSYSQSKQALNQVTVSSVNAAQQNSTPVRNESNAQQINYPANYNLAQLSNVNQDDPDSVQRFDQVAKPGLTQNDYQSDLASAQQSVDINNLSDQQATEMNHYAIDLINQARAHFNKGPFIQNQGTIDTVKGMAQQYQDKGKTIENESREQWHDETILNHDSENISAVQIYADNDPRLQNVVRPFATAKGSDFVDNRYVPLFSVTNMDDLRAMIYYGVTTMFFNDAGDYYAHAQNFLTRKQPIYSMAVYPSIVPGHLEAHVSDGTSFQYDINNVDMHYIWTVGLDNSLEYYGQPDSFQTRNNRVYYYGDDGKLYQGRWYNNWGHSYYFKADGARATSEIAQVGDDYYYFDDQGIMQTNYFLNQNGKVYYFGNDGKEYRDRFYNNWGHTYYFGDNGARYTDQFYTNWGHTYYFGADGARWDNRFYNNWGHTYYFGSDGARWDNHWMNAWGHSYYFKADGARATSEIVKIGNDYYYFDNQGIMQTNCFLNQNGKVYYFGSDGKEYRDCFYNNWGHTYYFGADGARYTNQFYTNWGHTYYFGNDGARWDNRFYNNWGHTYYFGSDGARWDNRWMDAWGNRYYFKADGVRATSENLLVDGKSYYFDNLGIAHDYFE